MASAAAADLPGPHHEADWGELSEESEREEDPVLDPELPSGSGKKRSESLEGERELRPERGLLPEEDYYQKEGNHLYTVEDTTLKDGNYQFQYIAGYKIQKASYYSAPKNLYLNYLKKSQNLTSNLKSTFLKYPYLLTSCQVKKKEAENYLNYATETYLRYKTLRHLRLRKELQPPPKKAAAPRSRPPWRSQQAEHFDNVDPATGRTIKMPPPPWKVRKACETFHHGRKGKEEVYPNKELIKDKTNNDLYYQRRKEKFYLNKMTRDKDNNKLYYKKERDKKEEKVNERKEGSGDKNESKDKEKEKKERKEKKEKSKNEVKKERKRREKKSGLDKYKVKKERKGRERKGGLDKYKTKFEKKEKKKGGKEEKEKNGDTIEVKCAQVSLCGAARVEQKEVGSPKLWKSCFESESMVVKLLLVVILAVSMYMFGVAEHSLKNRILENATWQDWYLSGRWQDWYLSKSDRDRHPSRKSLSKANCFRRRRHVRRRLALVGQVFKIVLFICMDTVHAMQHGPDTNPDLVANCQCFR